jgi:hypothetical protein
MNPSRVTWLRIMNCLVGPKFKQLRKMATDNFEITVTSARRLSDCCSVYCERFQVLTAASMMFRVVFWVMLPCKMIVNRRFRSAYCLPDDGGSTHL